MLAALLCNLGNTPPPPPAVAPSFFGGGPFRRYYRGELYEEARELRDELPGPEAEVVETAILKAVVAVREEKPKVVLDAKRIYDRVFKEVRSELRDELWKAEIQRRIHEQEEEKVMVFLVSL